MTKQNSPSDKFRLIGALLVFGSSLITFHSSLAITTNVIAITVTFTNAAGTTNGQTFAISNSANPNYTYTWTNAGTPAFKRLATTNSPAKAATNLYARLTNDWTSQSLRFSFGSPTSVVIRTLGYADLSAAAAGPPAYAIVSLATNGSPTNSTLIVSNLLTKAVTFWDGTTQTTAGGGGSGTTYTFINTNVSLGLRLYTNGSTVFVNTNQDIGLSNLPDETVTNLQKIVQFGDGSPTSTFIFDGELADINSFNQAMTGWAYSGDGTGLTNIGTNSMSAAAYAAFIGGSVDTNTIYTVASNTAAAMDTALTNAAVTFTNAYPVYDSDTNTLRVTLIVSGGQAPNNLVWHAAANQYTNNVSGAGKSIYYFSNGVWNLTKGSSYTIIGTNRTLLGSVVTNQASGANTLVTTLYSTSTNIYTTNLIASQAAFARANGAYGDGVKLIGANLTNSTLTVTTGAFDSSLLGKAAVVYLDLTNGNWRNSTIVAVNNSTNLTLAQDIYDVGVNGVNAWVGFDTTVAVSNSYSATLGDFEDYLPAGNYLMTRSFLDANSGRYVVLNLPTDRSTGVLSNTSRTIAIRGATPPMIYPQFINAGGATTLPTPNTGTILLNFARPVGGYQNVFVQHDGTNVGNAQFGRERYQFKNITLRQPGKPTHHAVYWARGGTVHFDNFVVDVDQTTNWMNAASGEPPFYMEGVVSNASTVYGIYGPDPYNYAGMTLEDVTIAYHGTGLRSGEHTTGKGKVSIVACGAAHLLDGAFDNQGTWDGCSFPYLFYYLCQYRMVVSTNSPYREVAWIGNLAVEEGYPRADIGSLVYDPLKRLRLSIGMITGTAQNTTIESTNGTWYDSINDQIYCDGMRISNGVVNATSFTGSGAGLTGVVGATVTTNASQTNVTLVGGSGTNRMEVGLTLIGSLSAPISVNGTNATSATIFAEDGKRLISYSSSPDSAYLFGAGKTNSTGARNIGIGRTAMTALTSGTDNVAIGQNGGLTSLTTGIGNTVVGSSAGSYLTDGANNTAVGYGALNGVNGKSMINCTAVGKSAGAALTNGDYNTYVGSGAGVVHRIGRYNTVVGGDALRDATNSIENCAFGVDALMSLKGTNEIVSYNASFGTYSLQFLTNGIRNAALGWNAGVGLLVGNSNIFIGTQSVLTNGSGNILIGVDCNALGATQTNALNIGNLLFGFGLTNGSAVSAGMLGIGKTNPATALDVAGTVSVDNGLVFSANSLTMAQAAGSFTNGGWKFVNMSNSLWLGKMSNNVVSWTNIGSSFFP